VLQAVRDQGRMGITLPGPAAAPFPLQQRRICVWNTEKLGEQQVSAQSLKEKPGSGRAALLRLLVPGSGCAGELGAAWSQQHHPLLAAEAETQTHLCFSSLWELLAYPGCTTAHGLSTALHRFAFESIT